MNRIAKIEVFNNDDTFAFWSIIWSKNDDEDYYIYNYPSQDLPLDFELRFQSEAQLIPRAYYRPSRPPLLTIAASSSDLSSSSSYIKKPLPLSYEPESPEDTSVADGIIREALVLESLTRLGGHGNICEYRGFVEREGYISGLCFKRYGKSLEDAVRDGDEVNVEEVLKGIKSGLEWLHSHGWVHGDICPYNIMLESGSNMIPVIIDFDSCTRLGHHITGKGGTPGWSLDSDIAEKENDFYGLALIEIWLCQCRL
ncbi:serine threonine-protein kinase [Moniliophthora roreri MCA 2997]|uniref:Serine threonine-protein kinase n=2 Tax=Moniliophthora roreri TaxID=221103 RepID=V2X9B5_MONRO|nr:serine threonine-protein kinase [Moniliophthora roreri MCA 2997]